MKYVTIQEQDFDSAVKKAREEYGHRIRIHSRRDSFRRGGFLWLFRRPCVELTCYLPEGHPLDVDHGAPPPAEDVPVDAQPAWQTEPEQVAIDEPEYGADISTDGDGTEADENSAMPAAGPDPLASLLETLLRHGRSILEENGFSEHTCDTVMALVREEFWEGAPVPTKEEFELVIVDKIVSLIIIDHASQIDPPHYRILLGPTGVGKTTTIAKLGALYTLQDSDEFKKSVHFLSVDTFRVGAFEQLSSFAQSLQIPLTLIANEQEMYRAIQELQDTELVLIDTIGRSPKDMHLSVQMNSLLSLIPSREKKHSLALPASMKYEDILTTIDSYRSMGIDSLIITKVDETASIGNVLSAAYEKNIPLLFFTDGQKVPSDLHKASATVILSFLRGFSLDFESLWSSQSPLTPQS
ncbi:MAG: hypothetical protein JXK93_03745 [Sphaerochaetaceae bacterium]|nr:hypothetical protein [Sphaerochaetaceae bacterium]